MSVIQAIIIGIVQGITEFLPISSTGHMVLTEAFMKMQSTEFVKVFTVSIQFGSILSVIILYWKRFFQTLDFYYKLFVAFIPVVILGSLLSKYIDSLIGNVVVVAISLLAGGVFLLFIDKWFHVDEEKEKKMNYFSALKIGIIQCIAMIPGVSRSAATIAGGMSQKLTRKTATEFSFFLAVPTLFAASVFKLYKTYNDVSVTQNYYLLLIGIIVAFIVSMIAIKTFITYITKHGFKLFGYYRIIVGLLIIILYLIHYLPLSISD